MGITTQSGLDYEDGILGLAPPLAYNGPSYLLGLKEQGLIENITMSFYLTKS